MVQPLWKTVGQFVIKLNAHLPRDLAVSLLDIVVCINNSLLFIAEYYSIGSVVHPSNAMLLGNNRERMVDICDDLDESQRH